MLYFNVPLYKTELIIIMYLNAVENESMILDLWYAVGTKEVRLGSVISPKRRNN